MKRKELLFVVLGTLLLVATSFYTLNLKGTVDTSISTPIKVMYLALGVIGIIGAVKVTNKWRKGRKAI